MLQVENVIANQDMFAVKVGAFVAGGGGAGGDDDIGGGDIAMTTDPDELNTNLLK